MASFEEFLLNLSDLCRLCMTKKAKDMVSIFSSAPGYRESYSDMIEDVSFKAVSDSKDLPTRICQTCSEELKTCFDFRCRILKVDEVLEHLQRASLMVKHSDKPIGAFSETSPAVLNLLFENNKEKVEPFIHDENVQNEVEVSCNEDEDGDEFTPDEDLEDETEDTLITAICQNRKCVLCLLTVDDGLSVKDHFFSHYKSSSLKPFISNNKRDFSCNICTRKFTIFNSVVAHHRMHLHLYPLECEFENCNRRYFSVELRRRHMQSHSKRENHLCHVCGKSFSLYASLLIHEGTHIIENVTCSICKNKFKNSHLLKRHMKRHLNESKFKCKDDGCNKAFSAVQDLNAHLRKKKGKTHFCDICSKAFYRSNDVKRHRLLHTTKPSHKCTTCGKAFIDKFYLKSHEKTHANGQCFLCLQCKKLFFTKTQLAKHQCICIEEATEEMSEYVLSKIDVDAGVDVDVQDVCK